MAWNFFVGSGPDGRASWTSYWAWQNGGRLVQRGNNHPGSWTPPGKPDLLSGSDADQCIGEHSLTWNAALDVWLLLYNCGNKIVARIAGVPWGPWSTPTPLLDGGDIRWQCTLLYQHGIKECANLKDDWPSKNFDGGVYAPFVLDRFTTSKQTSVPSIREATIFWLVSTWNPYQVVVMRTRFQVHAVRVDETVRPSSPIRLRK